MIIASYIFGLLVGIATLFIVKLSLGLLIRSNIRLFEKSNYVDLIVLGWGVSTYFLYLIERLSLPYMLSYLIVILTFYFLIFKSNLSLNFLRRQVNSRNLLVLSLLSLPVFLALASPYFLRGFLFFQNWGPDLDGNLISTGALLDGKQFSDLSSVYKNVTNSHQWWLSNRMDPWKFLDLRDGISIEFFLRSVRWGHAVEGKFLDVFFHRPVWYGILCLMAFSGVFTSLQIYRFLMEKKIPFLYSLLVPLTLSFGQSSLLMIYEGIQVQYIYAPIFIYLLLNIDRIYSENIKDLYPIVLGLLILMISFGEGAQIFLAFAVLFSLLNYKEINFKPLIKNVFVIASIFLLFFTAPLVDFVSWSLIRVAEKMDGGALHYDFSILNILTSLPYFSVLNKLGHDSIKLFINIQGVRYYIYNAIAILVVLLFAVMSFKKSTKDKAKVATISCLYFMTLITKHKYGLWKVVTLTLPVVWITFCKLIRKRRVVVTSFFAVLLVVNVVYFLLTIERYSKISEPVTEAQFSINKNGISGCYAVLTPNPKRAYLRLATVGQLNWLNGIPRQFDLPPNFEKINSQNCKVVVYYDCSTEGLDFCKNNAGQKTKPNFFNVSDKPLIYFLKPDNTPDETKINEYLKSFFYY